MKRVVRFSMLAALAAGLVFSACQKVETHQAELNMERVAKVHIRMGMDNSYKLDPGDELAGLPENVKVFFKVPYKDLGINSSADYIKEVTISGKEAHVELPVTPNGTTYKIKCEDFYAEYEESGTPRKQVRYEGQLESGSLNNMNPGENVFIKLRYEPDTSDEETVKK